MVLIKGRNNILQAIQGMEEVSKLFPQAITLIAFFDAKNDELISVFTKGDPADRREAYNALVAINPSETDKYQAIIKWEPEKIFTQNLQTLFL